MSKNILIKLLKLTMYLYYRLINSCKAVLLNNYSTAVDEVETCHSLTSSKCFAIFVYYERGGQVSQSVRNILGELRANSVNTILISNSELSDVQRNCLRDLAQCIIIRKNVGFDFGAYKDGINFISEQRYDVKRLILFNDSIYYFKKGLNNFVKNLLGTEDVIAAFENWERPHRYHFQSFVLSLSGSVFSKSQFRRFWNNYKPVSNRLHAIEHGEKALSKVLLSCAETTNVMYTNLKMYENLDQIWPNDFDLEFALPKHHRFENKVGRDGKYNSTVTKYTILSKIATIPPSPIHSGFYFYTKLGCPIVKKDLVYRGVYDFWEVETILRSRFNESEVSEFLLFLRKKGNFYSLNMLQKLKFNVGAL